MSTKRMTMSGIYGAALMLGLLAYGAVDREDGCTIRSLGANHEGDDLVPDLKLVVCSGVVEQPSTVVASSALGHDFTCFSESTYNVGRFVLRVIVG